MIIERFRHDATKEDNGEPPGLTKSKNNSKSVCKKCNFKKDNCDWAGMTVMNDYVSSCVKRKTKQGGKNEQQDF